jgi:hypothetical protein
MNPKPSPQLTGVAGEYFVAAELSGRGFNASITIRNTRGIDILSTNAEAKRTVKTHGLNSSAGPRNA